MTTIPHIRVPSDEFDALARGEGGAAAVALLQRGQLSKRLLRLRLIVERATENATDERSLSEAYSLLRRVQLEAPKAFREAMLQPHVGAWQGLCLSAVRDPTPTAKISAVPGAPAAYLSAVAASAAIRAGLEFRLTLPTAHGSVMFPLLGRAHSLPWTEGGAIVVAERGRVRLCAADASVPLPNDLSRDAPGWRAVRRLDVVSAGRALSVVLDDMDPNRESSGLALADELTDEDLDLWRNVLREAWEILVRDHPSAAEAVAAGLTFLVPLAGTTADRGVSATSVGCFGAAFMSLPVDAAGLAEAVVHEFQHSKLNGVLDLFPLCEPDPRPAYYAPWRDDPRPLPGLLHGVYAYLGVTAFWRVQRHRVAPTGSTFAHYEFARWREQAARAAEVLLASGALTNEGKRFVTTIARTLADWSDEPVPGMALAAARMASLDHWLTWRLKNIEPDPAGVLRLVDAWTAGEPCPTDPPTAPRVRAGDFAPVDNPRLALLHRRLKNGRPEDPGGGRPDGVDGDSMAAADAALIAGRYDAAVRAYSAEIRRDVELTSAWTGLALARTGRAPGSGASTSGDDSLVERPETVRAVYRTLRASGHDLDPEVLADWLRPRAVDVAAGDNAYTGGVSMSKSAR